MEVCAFSPCVPASSCTANTSLIECSTLVGQPLAGLGEALVQLVSQLPHRCRLLQRPLYLDPQPQAFRLRLGTAVQAPAVELRPLCIAPPHHPVAPGGGDHPVV